MKTASTANNLEVQPSCDALEKMCTFWKDKSIKMLRQGIFIPGITLTYLFTTLESCIFYSLFDKKKTKICTISLRKIWWVDLASSSTSTGKIKIREKEMRCYIREKNQRCVKRLLDTTPMHYTYGPSCKTCLLDHLRDEEKKLTSKKKVLPKWPQNG